MPPNLSELQEKWFLDFEAAGEDRFPPVARRPNSNLRPFSSTNLVTPVIEGAAYMKRWHDEMRAIIQHAQPEKCEVYHAGWILEDIATLGKSHPASAALDLLRQAGQKNAGVYVTLSGHTTAGQFKLIAPPKVNDTSIRKLDVKHSGLDYRYPVAGSCHQKFTIFRRPDRLVALLGSVDLYAGRWGRKPHSDSDSERARAGPDHEVSVQVEGSAIQDIQLTYLDRWNDSSRSGSIFATGLQRVTQQIVVRGTLPQYRREIPPPIQTSMVLPSGGSGPHSVQVLETYGITTVGGYSWSGQGEFTVWASYLNAIRKTNQYLYIEDQYFIAFGWPPCFRRSGKAQESSIIFQLGKAIQRGVKVFVVVSQLGEDSLWRHIRYQRELAVWYLSDIATSSSGSFTIAYLHNGQSSIYVHSKLMICDDEFVLVGSANISQRAMANDGEIHLGIVDANNSLAKTIRKSLWGEHMQLSGAAVTAQLEDPTQACVNFQNAIDNQLGLLRPYPIAEPGEPPLTLEGQSLHKHIVNTIIDPYAGPPR